MRADFLPAKLTSEMRSRPRLVSYGAVAVACALAVLVAAMVRSVAPETPSLLLLVPVICGSAFFGGLGPGLAATLLSVGAGYLLEPTQGAGLLILAIMGGDRRYGNKI
ncbi:MAG: DUF4118 domain-containing protein [Hyphomonadaceae bacterium]